MKVIKIKIKNVLKSKIKDMVKADIFWVKEKIKSIIKQRRHTKIFYPKVCNFFNLKDFFLWMYLWNVYFCRYKNKL